jgi:hypothetical protein
LGCAIFTEIFLWSYFQKTEIGFGEIAAGMIFVAE